MCLRAAGAARTPAIPSTYIGTWCWLSASPSAGSKLLRMCFTACCNVFASDAHLPLAVGPSGSGLTVLKSCKKNKRGEETATGEKNASLGWAGTVVPHTHLNIGEPPVLLLGCHHQPLQFFYYNSPAPQLGFLWGCLCKLQEICSQIAQGRRIELLTFSKLKHNLFLSSFIYAFCCYHASKVLQYGNVMFISKPHGDSLNEPKQYKMICMQTICCLIRVINSSERLIN